MQMLFGSLFNTWQPAYLAVARFGQLPQIFTMSSQYGPHWMRIYAFDRVILMLSEYMHNHHGLRFVYVSGFYHSTFMPAFFW